MKLTLLCLGSRGDVQPFVALGAGLVAAGFDVCISAPRGFGELMDGHGLEYAPTAFTDPMVMLQSEEGLHALEARNPVQFFTRLVRLAKGLVEQTLLDQDRACAGCDMVIGTGLQFGGGHLFAQKWGVPGCSAFVQPATSPTGEMSTVFTPQFPAWLPFRKWFNRLTHFLVVHTMWQSARPLLEPAWKKCFEQVLPFWGPMHLFLRQEIPALHGFSEHVIPRPLDWKANQEVCGHWFLDSAHSWTPPTELTGFLEAGPKPVYVGFGSMNTRKPEQVTEVVLQALEKTGQRGILATGWGGLKAERLPASVFRISSVPHDWLFSRVSAVVHHGGAGTTAAGLRAGVPSVVVPFFADQPFWAGRVRELGVGPQPIPLRKLSVERLVSALEQAVGDLAMRDRAREMGERIRAEDGVGNAVKVIQRLLKV